jgi:chromosome segregation protein
LKREKIGRVTFLPLNKINYRVLEDRSMIGKEGVHGIASNLIKFDKKHMEAVEFVFGNTIVVENLETSRKIGIGKVRMVTLDGDLAERSGVMIGGYLIRTHAKLMEKMSKDEIAEYIQLRQKLNDEIKKLTEQIEANEKRLKEFSEKEETRELVDVSKLKIDTEEELDKLRQERKAAYEKRLIVQTDLNRIKIQKAKIDAELENVKIEVEQYGDVKYLDQGVKTLENGINIAMRELSTLGPVNFKAIEQYESFSKEFDEYKRKYERILEEKKAVLDMIEQIENKRKEVFYKALQDMSVKFEKVYSKMTGGTGSLQLENPNDLESGLLIQANPGGKRLLNIDSMSGGEKTLVALAFLFAVQEFRPAPFYILDEVDAALDKENSKKVADLIKSLSTEAQFIVITHNDTTIKTGDRVYGITMESSESKVLALELPKE